MRPHTKSEKLNAFIHLLGVVFVVIFGPVLWFQETSGLIQKVGIAVYLLSFAGVFGSSAMYHFHSGHYWKAKLKLADQIWIYLFIAGTNTVYITSFANHIKGYIILAILYSLALLGIFWKTSAFSDKEWLFLLYYLLLGWFGGFTIYLIYDQLNDIALALLIAGGLFYTIGAYFYRHDYRRWFHAIWHTMVLFGAIAHFCALLV